jgi:hypothetical protein
MRKLIAPHDIDNRSDHDPVLIHLAIDYARFKSGPRLFTPEPAWSKGCADIKLKFAESLRSHLDEILVPYRGHTMPW